MRLIKEPFFLTSMAIVSCASYFAFAANAEPVNLDYNNLEDTITVFLDGIEIETSQNGYNPYNYGQPTKNDDILFGDKSQPIESVARYVANSLLDTIKLNGHTPNHYYTVDVIAGDDRDGGYDRVSLSYAFSFLNYPPEKLYAPSTSMLNQTEYNLKKLIYSLD